MKVRNHSRAAGILVSGLLMTGTALPALAQNSEEFPRMTLRSAQILVSTGIAQEAHQWWADEIEKRTNGQVTIETFWSGSLVAARDVPAAVEGGAADIGHVPSTYDPARTRLWMTLDMPFNVRDHWCGVDSSRRVAQENEHLNAEFESNNMLPLVGYNSGFQQYISKDPIKTVADLKGRRMRSYGGARVNLHEELGITPVFMPFGEIYEGIERGVLDGSADVAIYLADSFKLQEVANHFLITDSGVAVAAPLAVINRSKWESMPENLRNLISEVSREHDVRYARDLIEAEESLVKKFEEDPKVQVYHLSEEDRATMLAAAEKVQEEWLSEAEGRGLQARAVWSNFQDLQRSCEAEVEANGYPWK